MNIKRILILSAVCVCAAACNYLDVVPLGSPKMDDLFRTHTQANKFACAMYSHVYQPNKYDINASMELCGGGDLISGARGDRRYFNWKSLVFDNIETPSQTYFAAWIASGSPTGAHTYKVWEGIRNAYILLEHIDEVPDATDAERAQWRGEAYWIIAYYHHLMLEYYGPIIIVDHLISMNEDMNTPRSPYLDCVTFISNMYDKAAEILPATQSTDYYGRATSVLAKALKARLWLTAASPLVNGNNWYADFKNHDGTPLMPQQYDKELWKKAMDAASEAIEACEANGYGLYEISSASDDFTRGYENYRTAFIGPEGTTNFYNSKEDLFSENSSATHVEFFAPRTVSTYTSEGPKGYIVPTLKAVQTFLSKNGLPMDEDPETKNLDLYSIDQEQNTVLLHLNREPRFYASIGYDRGDYDFNGTTFKLLCRKGEPQQNDGIFANEYQTATGYYVKKWVSRADAYNLSNKSFTTGKHTLPLIRVAELYLDYAEAEAEYTGSLSQTGLRYIDVVRHRAGLPDFAEAWSRAGGTPTGEKLIKAIRQERLSEFVFEGRWYHDIRRWKVADEYIGHTPEGWNLDGSSATDFYKVTPVNEGTFVRSFATPKNYWFAIPLSQLNINKSLVKNTGYN